MGMVEREKDSVLPNLMLMVETRTVVLLLVVEVRKHLAASLKHVKTSPYIGPLVAHHTCGQILSRVLLKKLLNLLYVFDVCKAPTSNTDVTDSTPLKIQKHTK